MKNIVAALLILCSSQGFSQPLHDGPYVLYDKGQVFLKTIEDGKAKEQVFEMKNKNLINVVVSFPEHLDWNFSLKLKPLLKNEPPVCKMPEKLFVLSDIEGEFEGFRSLLIANKIIDKKYNWTFGKGHLVICGDLFDRGSQVPECMWLLYKLEQSAKAAGGYVHTILGNHDIMNLSGDLGYVKPKYGEATRALGLDYMKLYDKDAELGRWLRSKNIIEKIGDNLCAHAGVAPQVNSLKMSVEEINETCRPYYDKAKMSIPVPVDDKDSSISTFFTGTTSLFWYRGYFIAPKASEAEVDETLRLFGCNRIIVGHTIVPGNVGFYYNGKVLGLDVNQHEGDHQAALYEGKLWYKVNDKGVRVRI